jgi:steroid 5-alpha reductase family enzyme
MDSSAPPAPTRSLVGIAIAIGIAGAMAVAGSSGGLAIGAYPAFAVLAALAFLIQWLAFVPAYLTQTERYYDLVGSLTYLTVTGAALFVKGDARSTLLAAIIGLWALRLGSFLFLRIRDAGSDRRFDRIKPFPLRFLMTWTLQGLWVLVTAGAALAAMTSRESVPLGLLGVIGALLWLAGFAIEVIADNQKRRFRQDPANGEGFISRGLWAWSRHPNYFGEIVLWTGIALLAAPALAGWQYATLVSPLFVYLLLTRVSGVPLLERLAEKRWGEDPAWRAYRDSTPVLVLRPPKTRAG